MDRPSDATSAETVAVVQSQAVPAESSVSRTSSSSAADEGRFVPGTLLGSRYRIIALLGRGGMGEVYRATDLTLGQSVALKFLPEEAAHNQRLLERFHGEVRIARQVSHPNVCRVYDIGEVEGVPFISMEYVDGEDLASLLTRIGRLPADKAIETARKICAGLAAAHDRGIIHRDLKPQNIMMDRRGEVMIMDFGLAAIADQLSGAEARNGTPAYMAPEQLKGAEVSHRSDIYALGLVLYELFTGKRPYEAKTVRQMLDLQEKAQLTSMTSVAADIDPAVEKAVRRCLDPDPMRRPGSALSVAAALPGGDPLMAALAAGETPSPELVAAAGETEGLARKYSVPCLLLVVACLFACMLLRSEKDALMHAPLDLPPDAMAAKGREIAASFGYSKKPADTAFRLDARGAFLDHLKRLPEPRKWDEWLASEAPIAMDYRESQSPMVALPDGEVSNVNPPPISPGMIYARLDGYGRLLEFWGVPYQLNQDLKEPIQADAVFRACGLDIANFTETTPQELPTKPADQVRAWKGPHPKILKTELTVEIASWKGRITRIRVMPPWAAPNPQPHNNSTLLSKVGEIYPMVLVVVVLSFATMFARRNWKLDRVDRKGAVRVAGARFLLALAAWIGSVHAVASDDMATLIMRGAADWLISAAMLWLLYLALEPAVRARWPHSIVTWNRVLAGRWRDAQVGAHVLIGAALGCVIWLAFNVTEHLTSAKGTLRMYGGLFSATGTRSWIGQHAGTLAGALQTGLAFVFALFIIRSLVRRDWLAAIVASLLGILQEGQVIRAAEWTTSIVFFVVYAIIFFALLRFGLVASIVAVFFINSFPSIIIGLDWKAWYAPYGLATLVMLLGITFAAFRQSLGKRGLLGDEATEST